MKYGDLEILPTEELRVLHQKVTTSLKAKIIAEKKVLEDRLSQPQRTVSVEQTGETPERRSCATIFQKIPKSGTTFGNLDGPEEQATLADRTA